MIGQKNAKPTFPTSLKFLKNELVKFPKIPKLYKTTGLVYEHSGNLKTALKFYLIFSQINRKNRVYIMRTFFLCFWNGFHPQMNTKVLKIKNDYTQFTEEGNFFTGKYFELKGDFFFSQIIWKKIHIKKKKMEENFNILNLHLLCFWVRSVIKEMGLNLDFFQFKKMLFSLNYSKKKKSKIKAYLAHDFLELQTKYSSKIFNQLGSIKCLKVKKFKNSSLVFKNFAFFFERNYKNPFQFFNIFKYLGVFPKWSIIFGSEFLKEKSVFLFSIVNETFFNKWYESSESFNPFFRNPSIKIGFLLKIVKAYKTKRCFIQVIKTYRSVASEQPDNAEITSFLIRIQKKIFSKKKTGETFLRGARIYIQKTFGGIRKNKDQIINTKKLIGHAESFFEENKIIALSKLITSIFLFQIQPNKRMYTKKIKISFTENFDLKAQRNFFEKKKVNCTNWQSLENRIFPPSLENLLEKLLFFLLKKKKVFLEGQFKFLFGNLKFFKKGTQKRKFLSVFFLIKKKKFIRAYRFLRLECLENPNSIEGWYFLSNIEKEIGLLVSKTLRFSLRILIKTPETIPGIVFTGNHCSAFGSYGYALAEFFQAYRWKKSSPFLNFLICLQYLYGSLSRRNYFRGFAILLGLCFFWRYKTLRNLTAQNYLKRNYLSVLIEKEVDYNFGKFYLFMGSNYLAFKHFNLVHRKKAKIFGMNKMERRKNLHMGISPERESFFNLFLLNLCFGK